MLDVLYRRIKTVYTPRYILLNVIIAIIYFAMFKFLVGYGVEFPLVLIPVYLIFALVATSSVVFTISIFSFLNRPRTKHPMAKRAGLLNGAAGTAMPAVGSFVGGCGCHALAFGAIIGIVIGSAEAFSLVNFIEAYQIPIFLVFITFNLLLIARNISVITPKR